MATSFRRIVTGLDGGGKSTVAVDERVEEGALGNFNFWSTRSAGRDGAADVPFFPGTCDTVFRVFRLSPPDPAPTPDQMAQIATEFFAEVGSPACKVDTSRHPLMHVTPTTDYIVLLSGSVSLLLDTGEAIALKPFDAVVQRATNHAWIVTGAEPAVLVAVMVGASDNRGAP